MFGSIPDQYKTQEMCDTVVSEDPSLIVYCPDKYETQRICDETVNNCLAAFELVPDWFVTSKMTKTLFIAFYADGNIFYFNKGSGYAVFNCNGIDILNTDLNNINLD